MNFCSHCGSSVRITVPEGDNRERHVCADCGTIHYLNPKIIAGCIPVWEDRLLLCRRAIEPRHGLWTLPAGFMEQGEALEHAAKRETLEEANADVELEGLHSIFSLTHVSHVQMLFRARLKAPVFSPGVESLETRLFSEDEIPWDELAFETMRRALQYYLADRRRGLFELRTEEITRHADNKG